MDSNLQGLIVGLVGAMGGGLGVGWIAKLFFSNYIKTNDEKHKDAHDERKGISNQLSIMNTSIAVINTKLDAFNGIGKDVIVLQEESKKTSKDLHAAFSKLRELQQ